MEKKQAIPRVILIVGANRGIGYYMVEYLLEHGDFISVLDIEADNLEKLKENDPELFYETGLIERILIIWREQVC